MHGRFSAYGRGSTRDLARMVALSFAIHVGVVVVVVVAPWNFFVDDRPKPVSYTVDLIAADRLGGAPAPKSAPGAKRGVALPVPAAPKPAAKPAAAKPAAKPAPAKPQPKPQPPPKPKPQPKPPAKPAQKPPPKPVAKPAPEKPKVAKAELPKVAPKPKPQPEAKPKPKPQAKPQPKPEPKAKPEPKPQPKAEPKPQPKAEPQAKAKPEPKPPVPAAAKPAPPPEPAAPAAEAVDPQKAREQIAAQIRNESLAAAIARVRGEVAAENEAEGGTGLGGSGTGGGVVQGLDFLLYKGVVENSIRQNWAWAGHAPNLRVVVGFGIEPDGHIVDLEVVEASGDATYDTLALRAVQASDPLPPPPAAYQKEFSRYELELRADDQGG